jgi:hypothetical protein
MPPKSTELLLMHCDDTVYTATPDTNLYKLVDAICGTTGASALINEIFLARLNGALETIFYSDLDYAFSKINFLSRSPEESYPYNPLVDMLTADQWNEVRIKDAWYRARIRDYFTACGMGPTIDAIRLCVLAGLSCDCDVYEVWRYIDGFGLTSSLGRSPSSARNELVIAPHKTLLAPDEMRLIRDMLSRFLTLDTVITVNANGLAVRTPVPIAAAAADSSYYEVQKVVQPTALMTQLPPPDLLPVDLLPSEQWMYSPNPTTAPYGAFNMTQEYSYFYLAGGGRNSPIDSVTYGVINSPLSSKIFVYELFGTFSGVTTTVPSGSWIAGALNTQLFQWTRVSFPADQYPMEAAVATGVTNLINAINANPGQFVIIGYNIGAIIASEVYDQIRTGSLTSRQNQFLGGVVFGNARRQRGFTFPGNDYTHGQGIDGSDLLSDCQSLWYEFVVPGDVAADIDLGYGSGAKEDQAGQWAVSMFEAVYPNYSGNVSAVVTSLPLPTPPTASQLVQTIVDTFYGVPPDPNTAHGQYQSYQPLLDKGDYRSCIQIAADYVNSLATASGAALGLVPVTYPVFVYEVGGTELTSATDSWFSSSLDSRMTYCWVNWPAASYPMDTSVANGVSNLITLISRNPGRFALIGRNQGVRVISALYAQLQTGGLLAHRLADLQGVVTYGSPVRQAGKIFPGGTDPGGHGIDGTRMSSTPSLWWDFADPRDSLAVVGDDTNGVWMTNLFDAIASGYTGNLSAITGQFLSAPVNVTVMASNLINVIYHGDGFSYSTNTPLTGDGRTAYEIGRDYLNTFASMSETYIAAPSNPLSTYLPEANFESFNVVATYGPWRTYEIADSPDSYPGGKFGIHPAQPPAVNPDGTAYNFPWASQAAYVTFKQNQVISIGGQADNIHYRLPAAVSSTTKEVFLPEYAIAYSPPAQDTTVSTSLTRRRGKTVNQSGSNQRFVRTSP